MPFQVGDRVTTTMLDEPQERIGTVRAVRPSDDYWVLLDPWGTLGSEVVTRHESELQPSRAER